MAANGIWGQGGITAVKITARRETVDPVFFEAPGPDIGAARTVCVNSRGHFGTGFDSPFAPEQVHEIDAPGVTSMVVDRFERKGLPRPLFPLEPATAWSPSEPN